MKSDEFRLKILGVMRLLNGDVTWPRQVYAEAMASLLHTYDAMQNPPALPWVRAALVDSTGELLALSAVPAPVPQSGQSAVIPLRALDGGPLLPTLLGPTLMIRLERTEAP